MESPLPDVPVAGTTAAQSKKLIQLIPKPALSLVASCKYLYPKAYTCEHSLSFTDLHKL